MAKTAPTTPPRDSAPPAPSRINRVSARMGDGDVFDVGDDTKRSGSHDPVLVGGGLLFAALAMLAGALLLNARGERRAVVVSTREIPAGTVIQADMLRIDHIEADTKLRALPGPRYGTLVGQVARERIPAGVLVVEEQVGAALQPPAGFSLVAMTLEAGELPVASLAYGDNVAVVRTPQSASADDPGGVIATAAVWSMWQQSAQAVTSGSKRALTLAVPDADAVAVTQAAARREIRLIAVGGDPVFAPRNGQPAAALPDAVVPANPVDASTPEPATALAPSSSSAPASTPAPTQAPVQAAAGQSGVGNVVVSTTAVSAGQ